MTVSKTLQFALFTTNANAVWRAKQQLQKESFPFPIMSISLNRNLFRLQVGDVVKFSHEKYGISNMIIRVLQIEEHDLASEKINLEAMQDIFSVANTITEYSKPINNLGQAQKYLTEPFDYQTVVENPYVLSDSIQVIPMASKKNDLDSGFSVYMSLDGGSYDFIESSKNIQPFGTLNAAYGLTYAFDREDGIFVDFVNGANLIESASLSDILSGKNNMALLGDELISFQNITPISGSIYKLENVIRGRFGTQMAEHSIGSEFYYAQSNIQLTSDSNILVGTNRKFKLVPFNIKKSGSIVDATPIDLSIEGESSKPYEPINFNANDTSLSPAYISGDNIPLTWSPRFRGSGCGTSVPGVPIAVGADHEGLFKIEVWVSSIKVREVIDINAITWDYTDSMNISDNGSQADEILFKLYNYRISDGITYISKAVEVYCRKEAT